jgi:hypothetical protein
VECHADHDDKRINMQEYRGFFLPAFAALQLLTVPYMYSYKGLESFATFAVTLATVPFVVSRFRVADILLLVGCFACALAATGFAGLRFPEARDEYAKCLLAFGVSLFGAYVTFVTFSSLSTEAISRVFTFVTLFFIIFSSAEVLLPPVRALSTRISEQFQVSSQMIDNHRRRDEMLHGGFGRPLCGTSEPARVAIPLGVGLGGLILLRRGMIRKNIQLLIMIVVALAATRSPSLLLILIAAFLCRLIIERGSSIFKLLYWSPIVLVILLTANAFFGERIEKITSSDDGSFKERLILPMTFTYVSMRDTYGLGIGFLGAAAERGNTGLRQFFPMVVEAVDLADVPDVLKWYSERNYKIHAGSNAFCTHWIFNGIPLGLLSAFFAYRFVQNVRPGGAAGVFFLFLFLGTAVGGYETLKLSQPLMMLIGCLAVSYREESSEDEELESGEPGEAVSSLGKIRQDASPSYDHSSN